MSPLRLSAPDARRFMRRALRFDAPHAGVAEALAHHGYVQIDPINVCGRMHDLILRSRVAGYREHGLMEHLYAPGERGAFEHYVPHAGTLVAFPVDAFPLLAPHMRRRRTTSGGYAGKLDRSEAALARRILGEIERRGPLTSDDIEHGARAKTAWGTEARMAKTVLEKMFVQGRVLLHARSGRGAGPGNLRRIYDLPERVLPARVLAAPQASPAALRRFLVLLKLRQRRLVLLKRGEPALVDDVTSPVEIDGVVVHALRDDLAALDATPLDARPRLIAPLDPLAYDRRLTRHLFGFDYTWEVYTPAAKRVRGYYALPLLAGDRLVGHADLKADRDAGVLRVVSKQAPRGCDVRGAIAELAAFLGLRAPRAGRAA